MAMSTNMIDSIHATCHNIPAGTRKVAGYVTGSADIRWRRADWDRFSPRHTGLVRIDQSFGGRDPLGSDVLDVERGAATPGAPGPGSTPRPPGRGSGRPGPARPLGR